MRLGEIYKKAVEAPLTEPLSEGELDRVIAYLRERALIRKYKAKTADELRIQLETGRTKVQLQDWWLCAPNLRSSTGSEREQSFTKTVAACQELDLLAETTLTVTSYGRLLMDVARERALLDIRSGSEASPFIFEPAFAVVALYRVIVFDLPMQRHLVAILAKGRLTFQELCLQAERILTELMTSDIPNSPGTRDVRRWITKEIANARKLSDYVRKDGGAKGGETTIQTLYRPFEDMFLPRLEFMVDAGLAVKPEAAHYIYDPSPHLEAWKELLAGGAEAMEDSYFSVVARTHAKTSQRLSGATAILKHMSVGFSKYRGITGYAPILEAVMYSNLATWGNEPWSYIEMKDAMETLRALSAADEPSVRILSDRYRRPEAFTLIAGR